MMPLLKRISVKENGAVYNCYLISGEKTALIDTVPAGCAYEMTARLKEWLGGKELDYIILNHTECDRSGALAAVTDEFPDVEIIATIAGLKNIAEQLNREFKQTVAKSGAELKLGENLTLRFIITHNINWPDSMMTFLCEEKTLFSCDAFSDEGKGRKAYYDKNLSYLGEYVLRAAEQLKELDINRILPGNGEEINTTEEAVNEYIAWSGREKCKGISVVYESVSGNTQKAAERACELIKKLGFDVRLINAAECGRESVLENIYSSDGVIFGSPTVCRNIPQRLLNVIVGMNHYRTGKIRFAAFGSYGWSGEAPNLIYSYLRARHFQTFGAPYRFLFSPSDSEIESFDKYISDFCEQLKAEL